MGLHFYVKKQTTGDVVCLQGMPSEYGLEGCEVLSNEAEYKQQRADIYTKAVKKIRR